MSKSVVVWKVKDHKWRAGCYRCGWSYTAKNWHKAASHGWRHRC